VPNYIPISQVTELLAENLSATPAPPNHTKHIEALSHSSNPSIVTATARSHTHHHLDLDQTSLDQLTFIQKYTTMSTPQVADISTQKKANRKKSKKASAEGASSPTDANNVNEVTALLKLIPEQLEPSQDPATDLKRENEAMKEISK